MSYARELIRQGKAYPCFATSDELAAMRKQQQAEKVPPGYYGRWALWRDATPEQVQAKLDEAAPYVVRFRSPGTPGQRVEFDEVIRGRLSAEDNYNDVVILKSEQNGAAGCRPITSRTRSMII